MQIKTQLQIETEKQKMLNFFKEKYPEKWDLIDVNALYDNKLNWYENQRLITEEFNKFPRTIEYSVGTLKTQEHQQQEHQKEVIEKIELQAEREFEKSINNIKFKTSNKLDESFKIIDDLVHTLIKSDINGMIVKGNAGVGKTYNIIKSLKNRKLKKGKDYEILSSWITPLELHKFLFDNRENKILILDDTIGFFSNHLNVGIILSALWGDGKRIINYFSSSGKLSVPKSFLFNSKIIWCVNEIPKGLEAIKSRCYFYEIKFKYSEIIKLMYEIAKVKKIPFEVVDFIKDNADETTENMDFRLLLKINEVYKNNKNWKEISKKLIGQKDNKLSRMKELLNESNTIKEAEKKFCMEFDCCRKTFYNLKNKLE